MHALGWIDPISPTPEWDRAQVRRLARRLGFRLRWADPNSLLGLAEQVESGGVDVVLMPSTGHIDAMTLNRVLCVADVECAAPRESLNRWSLIGGYQR